MNNGLILNDLNLKQGCSLSAGSVKNLIYNII